MADPRAYYKSLRLGDTVRSHPPVGVKIEPNGFEPTIFGDAAVAAERGAAALSSVQIEPVLLRNYAGAETDAAFFARKLAFASALASWAGVRPATRATRLGPLAWIADFDVDEVGTVSSAVAAGDTTADINSSFDGEILSGNRVLIVDGDEAELLALTADFANAGTPTATSIDFAACARAYTTSAKVYRLA